jgi:hypothetical protein
VNPARASVCICGGESVSAILPLYITIDRPFKQNFNGVQDLCIHFDQLTIPGGQSIDLDTGGPFVYETALIDQSVIIAPERHGDAKAAFEGSAQGGTRSRRNSGNTSIK